MIKAIIANGIGFGGVNFIPTLGFTPYVPVQAHSIYRLDQDAAGGDMFRGTAGGSSDIFRAPPSSGGKMYR